MPRYFYRCTACHVKLDVYHGMSEEERLVDCDICGTKNCIERMPTNFITESVKADTETGSAVKKAIKDFQADLNDQKDKLKNQFYETDK